MQMPLIIKLPGAIIAAVVFLTTMFHPVAPGVNENNEVVQVQVYKVTRWDGPETISTDVKANNHRDAAKKSGLIEPGAVITVDVPTQSNIRYQVDKAGRLREIAIYRP